MCGDRRDREVQEARQLLAWMLVDDSLETTDEKGTKSEPSCAARRHWR
jgi:hypothetical protein